MPAPLKMTFELDPASVARFSETLEVYRRATHKGTSEVVNRAAKNVAMRAVEFTKFADRSKMESQLGQIQYRHISNAKGKRHGTALKKPIAESLLKGTLAYNIVAAGIYKHGGKGSMPRTEEIKRLALKMVAKRIASIHYIRSGWIPAAKKFAAALGEVAGHFPRPRAGKGGAKIAVVSLTPTAELWNQSIKDKGKNAPRAPLEIAGDGLNKAFTFVENDMRTYAESLLDKNAREFNAAR